MRISNLVFLNMVYSGIIEKGDDMKIEITPEIDLSVRRFNNQVYFSDNNSNYIVEVQIMNKLGVLLYTFRFNEFDAIKILDCIDQFQYDFGGETYSNMLIKLPPMNSLLNIPYLFFQWGGIDKIEYDRVASDDYNDIPDILFEIREYSPMNEIMKTLFRFSISENTLDDISFAIYFVSILDIIQELPMEYQSSAENITSNMFRRKDRF